jgi:hypothetical protein
VKVLTGASSFARRRGRGAETERNRKKMIDE